MLWSSLATLAFLVTRPSLAWRVPGVEQRYTEEKLVDAGSLGLPSTGLVAAFADWNADGLVDLVHLGADQRSLAFYTWDRRKYTWTEATNARIRTHSDFVVTNVVPGDFDHDGRVDLLVVGGKNPGGWWGSDQETDMQVYLQQPDGSFGAFCRSPRPARRR